MTRSPIKRGWKDRILTGILGHTKPLYDPRQVERYAGERPLQCSLFSFKRRRHRNLIAKHGQRWSLTTTVSAAIYQRQNCGAATALLAYRRTSSKENFVGLATLWDVLRVSCSGPFSCPHRLTRGNSELEANWRCGPRLSRTTWNLSIWTALVSSHRTVEAGVPPSTRLVIPAQPAPEECRHMYKKVRRLRSDVIFKGKNIYWNHIIIIANIIL